MQNKVFVVNNKEYIIEKLLGKGKSGFSYLVKDENNNKYVLKKMHHEPCDYYKFSDKMKSEYSDYNTLNNLIIRMPRMIDYDYENESILKEYIEGELLTELIENNQMKQVYFDQIKEICKTLYKNNLNIDYYPTNFVVKNDVLYYVDYECNQYSDEWNFENWGIKYWYKNK